MHYSNEVIKGPLYNSDVIKTKEVLTACSQKKNEIYKIKKSFAAVKQSMTSTV